MTERQQEILQIAIETIADEGYAALTMRALARASGMKLGALQYHFRTSEDLLRAVVDYISQAYGHAFDSLQDRGEPPGLGEIVAFVLDDKAGEALCGDRLGHSCGRCNRSNPSFRNWWKTFTQVTSQHSKRR